VAGVFLRSGSEDRFRQLARGRQTLLEPDAADHPGLLILLETRADEIAACHAFDGDDLALLHENAPASEIVEPPDLFRKLVEVRFEEVVLDLVEPVEPEVRDLREDRSLVGDARREHDVECGDPIGRDEEVLVAEIIDVADFAAAREREGEGRLRDCSSHGAGIL
jgi:hypothetical protein